MDAKPIRFSAHAFSYMERRGFSREDVEKAIRTCAWEKAERDRWECRLGIPFCENWNGHEYAFRQIRPIFVEEQSEIVVITVYVYYY
jgi:hypothetical protein